MKLGIILTSYACEDLIDECLKDWILYQNNKNIHGNEVVITANSFPFLYFPAQNNKENLKKLFDYKKMGVLDEVFHGDIPIHETDARNKSLFYLLDYQKVEAVLILDNDEQWSHAEIDKTINYIKARSPQNYRINYRNIVFDGKSYLEAFDPCRIWFAKLNKWYLHKFYDDNAILYTSDGQMIRDIDIGFSYIPKAISHPKHISWMNNERSKMKVLYHTLHFGNGNPNACSFKWNEIENKLEFNEEYYKLYNKEIPTLHPL